MSRLLRNLDPRPFFSTRVARSHSFRTFWIGQGVSQVGSAVSLVVIPLIAAIIVGVTPAQMGILVALETGPALIFTIPAGVLADRTDRRVIMIGADLARAAAVGLIPLGAMTGHLSFELMALVAFAMGSLGIVFDVTYEGFMAEVIEIEDLTEGFQKLEITASGAGVVGPGIGGTLLSVCGVALTIGIDAFSYLVSAASLFLTKRRADLVRVVAPPTSLRGEFSAGMRLVFGDRILRDLAISTALLNLGSGVVIPLVVLFATRNLGLNAGEYGLLYSISSTGFVLGAASVGLFGRRLGSGRGLTVAATGFALSILLVPMASPGFGVLFLVAARFFNSAANTTHRVLLMSLRQTRADPAFRSRITSSFRMISWGSLPIGSLVGGALAGPLGIVGALVLAGIMPLVGVLILRTGPVWQVRLNSLELANATSDLGWRSN